MVVGVALHEEGRAVRGHIDRLFAGVTPEHLLRHGLRCGVADGLLFGRRLARTACGTLCRSCFLGPGRRFGRDLLGGGGCVGLLSRSGSQFGSLAAVRLRVGLRLIGYDVRRLFGRDLLENVSSKKSVMQMERRVDLFPKLTKWLKMVICFPQSPTILMESDMFL